VSTIVFQSFRTRDVPRYITACLTSVRTWAQGAGYTYQFLDDRFLDLVPSWYRQKAGPFLCVVADLARLLQARNLLSQGFEQVIWMDADLIVFAPDRLRLPQTRGFQYCRETWLCRTPEGALFPVHKINNSVCTFGPDSLGHLDTYIDQCLAWVRDSPGLSSGLEVGTNLLSQSQSLFENIRNIGIISPILLEAILRDEQDVLARYSAWHGGPVFAANLCNAYRRAFEIPGLFDYLVEEAVGKLLKSQGGSLAR
jgi:hypothetical protein